MNYVSVRSFISGDEQEEVLQSCVVKEDFTKGYNYNGSLVSEGILEVLENCYIQHAWAHKN